MITRNTEVRLGHSDLTVGMHVSPDGARCLGAKENKRFLPADTILDERGLTAFIELLTEARAALRGVQFAENTPKQKGTE